jgi:hypothetical protein
VPRVRSPSPRVAVASLFVGYLALVVWLTWPLGASLRSVLPCTSLACGCDTLHSAWILAWGSHALTTAPMRIADANIYFPAPHALFYGQTAFGSLPYFLPTFLLTGDPALAMNGLVLVTVALSALGLHWVVWRWTGLHSAGFVAACALLVNRWYLWGFAASAPHLLALHYLPLIIYLGAKPRLGRRGAAALMVLIVLQALVDPVYDAIGVMAPLAVLALARLARTDSRRNGVVLLLVLAVVPFAIAPVIAGYVWVRAQNPSLLNQSVWRFLPELPAAQLRTHLDMLFVGGSAPTSIGLPILVTIGIGAVTFLVGRSRTQDPARARAWTHAGLWAVVGTYISISPTAFWGTHPVVLPHVLLERLTPLYGLIHGEHRLGVGGMMGLCLLFGLAFAEITGVAVRMHRRAGPAVRAVAATAIAVTVYAIPGGLGPLPAVYPTQPVLQTSDMVRRRLRGTQGPLLELPAMSPEGIPAAQLNAVPMYRSIGLWRPLVNGYASYWPAGFLERAKLTPTLPERETLERLVCETSVRSILVNLWKLPPEQQTAWLAARRDASGLKLVGDYSNQLVFDVSIPLPGALGGPTCPSAE